MLRPERTVVYTLEASKCQVWKKKTKSINWIGWEEKVKDLKERKRMRERDLIFGIDIFLY